MLLLKFNVLSKSEKLGIDNTKASFKDFGEKLKEECNEVYTEINNVYEEQDNINNIINLVRETYDVIQVCIAILWKSHKLAKEKYKDNKLLKRENMAHNYKLLAKRQWSSESKIEVEVKE